MSSIVWANAGLSAKGRATASGARHQSNKIWSSTAGARVALREPMTYTVEPSEEYEGFTKAQFMTALQAVSEPMAHRALKAKEEGMLSVEESERFLDDLLNATG